MSRESDSTCINMLKGNVLTKKYIKIPQTQALPRAIVVPCIRGKFIDKKAIEHTIKWAVMLGGLLRRVRRQMR